MHLLELNLRHFRKWEEYHLDFRKGLNGIFGPNGTGKTTVLEAIHLLLSGSSFRTLSWSEMIQYNQQTASIQAIYSTQGMRQTLEITFSPSSKTILSNRDPLKKKSELLGKLLGVTIALQHFPLLSGPPSVRRSYLDWILTQLDPLFLWHTKRYYQALKIKNHLLKTKHTSPLFTYEKAMSQHGAYIQDKRASLLKQLEPLANTYLQLLFSKQHTLHLNTPTYSPEELLEQWEKQRGKEIYLGYNTVGPEKEDLSIYFNQQLAKAFGSEGEKKGILISLKLAFWQLLKETSKMTPLLLIDDLPAYFDAEREKRLLSLLEECGQVIYTAPTPRF